MGVGVGDGTTSIVTTAISSSASVGITHSISTMYSSDSATMSSVRLCSFFTVKLLPARRTNGVPVIVDEYADPSDVSKH